MQDYVFVPVRWEHIENVRAYLKRLEAQWNGEGNDSGEVTERPRAELLRKIYEDCAESTQRMLLYLADNAGKWIPGGTLAEVANPQGKSRNSSPYFRSLNSAASRYQREGEPYIVEATRDRERLFWFKMSQEDAEIMKEFAR